MLAGKGSLRRAQKRRALADCAPFRREVHATGGSGGNRIGGETRFMGPDGLAAKKNAGVYTKLLTLPQLTKRRAPLSTEQIIAEMNPIVRGWGQYYKRSRVRRLFTQLDAWIVRRLWSHRCKHWRCEGWKQPPQTMLNRELRLVSLLRLHLQSRSP